MQKNKERRVVTDTMMTHVVDLIRLAVVASCR